MKHSFAVLLFTLFFTLTSANREAEIETVKIKFQPKKQVSKKYFVPDMKSNNLFIKTAADGKKYQNQFDEIYENLPAELKPKE